jgi:hypothetical protein
MRCATIEFSIPIFPAIALKRRSVQSYIGIDFFLLEKSRYYGAANSTFLGGSVRVK